MRHRFGFAYLASALVVSGLLLGACATLPPGDGESSRVYTAPMATVMEAASDAFVENGLEIETSTWRRDSTFVIVGTRRARVMGNAVPVARLNAYLKPLDGQRVRVEMEQDRRPVPAAASGAERDGQARQDIRAFFRVLDGKLNR